MVLDAPGWTNHDPIRGSLRGNLDGWAGWCTGSHRSALAEIQLHYGGVFDPGSELKFHK